MANKKYKLTFELTDGSKQEVEFAVPVPDTEEIVDAVIAALPV